MYLRFVIATRDEDSGRSQGVFAAAYALLKAGNLDQQEHGMFKESLAWFEKNVPIPRKFKDDRAVFWFKAQAGECINRIWTLVGLLREHGIFVRVVRTKAPGQVLHEDEFQIAAVPCKRTPR